MSRYRAPAGPTTALITEEGFSTLQQEQKDLWLKRREVTAALSAAAAEGDRSENAEYIYRKKELAGIDRRVRYLQKRLPSLRVVKELPTDQDKVYFGATVNLSDESGDDLRVRIVGPDEIDPSRQWISVDSVMARALLKNSVGDEITVTAPKGQSVYYIEEITYRQ